MKVVTVVDRYLAAGLSSNPFAAEVWAAEVWAADELGLFVDRGLAAPPAPGSSSLVQVLGQKGHGKTTHVLRWRTRTPGPYHYVPRSPRRRRWDRPPVAPLVYADEIDRMPWAVRLRWFRASARIGATIVAGTHRDLSGPARRAGLQVITHRLGPVDVPTLRRMVEFRMRRASVAKRSAQLLDDDDVTAVHRRCGGNLRTAETMLHDILAQRVHALEPNRSPQ